MRYEFDPDDPLDSDLFTIDASSGQIRVKTQGALDYETQPMPTVKVKASDSSNASDTVVVTIEVTDVNEPPRRRQADAPDGPSTRTTEGRPSTSSGRQPTSDPERQPERADREHRASPGERVGRGERPREPRRPTARSPTRLDADYNGSDSFTYQAQ